MEWNGYRFRKWPERIGTNTCRVVKEILSFVASASPLQLASEHGEKS